MSLTKNEISRMSHPILSLTMEEIVEGHKHYGHNFQELINQECDNLCEKTNKYVEKYHVENVDGIFTVFAIFSEDNG